MDNIVCFDIELQPTTVTCYSQARPIGMLSRELKFLLPKMRVQCHMSNMQPKAPIIWCRATVLFVPINHTLRLPTPPHPPTQHDWEKR